MVGDPCKLPIDRLPELVTGSVHVGSPRPRLRHRLTHSVSCQWDDHSSYLVGCTQYHGGTKQLGRSSDNFARKTQLFFYARCKSQLPCNDWSEFHSCSNEVTMAVAFMGESADGWRRWNDEDIWGKVGLGRCRQHRRNCGGGL